MNTLLKNPWARAVAAEIYIILVVLCLARFDEIENETILAPIGGLSLFVLSAAIMGFLFLAEPILMYLDGKKKEAFVFFGQTLCWFAGITAVVLVVQMLMI